MKYLSMLESSIFRFYLQNISRIFFLSISSCSTLIQAAVISPEPLANTLYSQRATTIHFHPADRLVF